MGYSTSFEGSFDVSPALTPDQVLYLKDFAGTRRMKRSAEICGKFPDPIREAVGLPIGVNGEFFVGNTEDFGQRNDESILEYNSPSETQPGLWCKWEPTEDGTKLKWNGAEKFYDYVDWLKYIIKNFMEPWGRTLNGVVLWEGEDESDRGIITVENNQVFVSEQ